MPEEMAGDKKAIDLSEEMRPIEGQGVDEVVIQASHLMHTFIKTIKAFRLYPPENPSLNELRAQLSRKFQLFLDKYLSFVFQIGEYDLSFKGKILYENKDLQKSLAFRLYKDGLRELRFMKGLEEGEVQALIDILKRVDRINQLEDDLITLMWEADFVHISYLATDEFLDEMPVVIPENVAEFKKHLRFEPVAHKVELDFGESGEQDGFDLQKILAEKNGGPPSFVAWKSFISSPPTNWRDYGRRSRSRRPPPLCSISSRSFLKSWH
jgi:hypothetical protein